MRNPFKFVLGALTVALLALTPAIVPVGGSVAPAVASIAAGACSEASGTMTCNVSGSTLTLRTATALNAVPQTHLFLNVFTGSGVQIDARVTVTEAANGGEVVRDSNTLSARVSALNRVIAFRVDFLVNGSGSVAILQNLAIHARDIDGGDQKELAEFSGMASYKYCTNTYLTADPLGVPEADAETGVRIFSSSKADNDNERQDVEVLYEQVSSVGLKARSAGGGGFVNYTLGPRNWGCDTTSVAVGSGSYTITYDANGGDGTLPGPTVGRGDLTLASGTGLTKTSIPISSWNTLANGTGVGFGTGSTYRPIANITLFAQYVAQTVTFDKNHADATGTMPNQEAAGPTALNANAYGRGVGFGFAGWNTLADGSGTPYADGAVFPFSTSRTLFAQWATPPSQGTGLSLVAGDGQIVASWSAPAANGSNITGYLLEYATNSSFTSPVLVSTSNLNATVTGLSNGVTYFFQVAAINGVGTGAVSSTVSAVPSGAGDTYLAFDGSNDYGFYDGAIGSQQNRFAIEAWAYDTATTDGARGIFRWGDSNRVFLDVVRTGNRNELFLGVNGSGARINTDIEFPSNQWVHLAVVREDAAWKLYVDGHLAASGTQATAALSEDLWVGTSFVGDSSNRWNGRIDQVKLWDHSMTAANVATSMNTYAAAGITGGASAPDLLAHYDLNVPSVSSVVDVVGGKNLALTGSVLTSQFVDVASETVSNGEKIVTFSRSYLNARGGWTVPAAAGAGDYLVVGGGASGGRGVCGLYWGHGGGGGGVAIGTFTGLSGVKPVTVGVGGLQGTKGCEAGPPAAGQGTAGTSSIFNAVTATGGLAGVATQARGGSSGTPTSSASPTNPNVGGLGTGNGTSCSPGDCGAGGGAGAGGAGSVHDGGPGRTSTISGTNVQYGAGGAGTVGGVAGSSSGGGTGSNPNGQTPGSGGSDAFGNPGVTWGAGAPGIVILRYELLAVPTISSQPASATVQAGANGTFSVTASPAGATFQWQQSTNGGVVWTDVAGGTSATLTLSSVTADTDGNQYRVVITNTVGGESASATSNLAILTVEDGVTVTGAFCDGNYTKNGLTVSSGHGTVFYIDTGQGQKIDAGYIGYVVQSANARDDLWVEVTDFTGGVVSLANPGAGTQPLGSITSGGSDTAFFMIKASGATTTAQSHIVNVYGQKPSIGNPKPLYSCGYSFVQVAETIKAAANKLESITSTTTARIGSTMTITVRGDTGTIGQGNNIDGRMIWVTPAARSDWPTDALRLESTSISFFSNANRAANSLLSTHPDTLRVNTASVPALAGTNRQYYTATYTFRVIGSAANIAPIIPIAMISSGTQVKHTDVGGLPTGGTSSVDLRSPSVDLTVTKNVNPTTVVNSDGTTTMRYSISLRNGGSDVLVIDEVVDTPDSELSYVAGTAQFNGVAMRDPGRSGTASIAFSGPLSLPANSTRVITYDMTVVTCAVGGSYSFDNTATARTGTVVIGSGSATQSAVNIAGNCAQPQAVVTVTEVPIDPAVVTGGANSITATSATILGTVDPNSRSGLDVRFRYGTNANTSASTTVVLADTTFSASAYGVSTSLTGLTGGTTYYYVLEVEDPDGGFISGTVKSFTTVPVPSPPAALTLTQTDLTVSSAVLNGSIDANLQAGGVKVVYQWFKDVGTSCAVPGSVSDSGFLQSEVSAGVTEDALLTGSSAVPMSHAISGLDSSARYCFRVVAHYSTGFGVTTAGNWMFFTTGAVVPQNIVWGTSAAPLAAGGGAGGTTTVTATAKNSDTTNNSGLAITYSSVNTSICTVNASTGVVTSVATSGTCTITATQAGGASGGITYAAATPTSISFPISPPVVSPATLLAGTYQTSGYSQPLLATGGTGTYSTWGSTGTLPPGIALNSSTGLLSGTPTAAGVYTFSVTTVSNGVTSAPRQFTITIAKAAVTVTAASLTVTYGGAAPGISPSYSGFLGSDQSGVNTSPNIVPTCTSNYVVGQNATTTAVTSCSAGSNANYSFTYVTGLITVAKFPVVVTALDAAKQNRISGSDTIVSADPTLQWTATSPLPAGQTMGNVVPGGVSISRAGSGTASGTIATASLPAGEVDGSFVITASGIAGSNYTVTYVTGLLTIQEPKEVVALTVTNKTMTYGDVSTAAGLIGGAATNRVNGVVAGTTVYTCVDSNGTTQTLTNLGGLPAGTYVVTVAFTPTDGNLYYTAAPVRSSMVLTVERKAAVVTAVDNKKRVGSLDPVLTWSGAGFLAGDDAAVLGPVTISRAAGETAGSFAITTTGGNTPNYVVSHVPALFYVYEPVITVTQNQGVLTSRVVAADCRGVKPGATANFILETAGTPSTIATSTVNADGTCPMTSTLGTSVPQGLHTLRIETQDPLNNNVFRTQSIILLAANIAVAPTPGSNPGNPGGGRPPLLANPNEVTVGPFTFRRPAPTVVTPAQPLDGPAVTGAEPNRVQGEGATSLPRLPGMPSTGSPSLPGSQGTVDFGNGVQSRGNSAGGPSGPTTQSQGGGQSSAGQGVRTVDQLANERLGGFQPGVSTRIEVLGARSGARFVVAEAQQIDSITMMQAITASIPTQAANFFSLDNVLPTVAPTIPPAWLPEQREAIGAFFAAAGLAAPQSLADLEGRNFTDWVQVSGSAETYVPGSIVYLTVTSEPLVIASAEVARDGRVVITGSIPVEWLQAGEHRIRLVGIRALDGVSVDEDGEIQLSAELMDEIQRFDLGTQSTIAVMGENLTGGEHVAMRVVPLVPIAPWWTLWFIALGFLVVAAARWRGALNTRSRQVLGGLIVVASSVPGVIIGWLSTVTSVVWWAIGLGLLGAIIQGFLPVRRESKRAVRS